MAAKGTDRKGKRCNGADPATDDVREIVMEALLQLHVDFVALGALDQAGPLLQRLMELAYHSAVIRTVPNTSAEKRLPKPAMN